MKRVVNRLLWAVSRRALFFATGDIVIWAVGLCLAFLIRFDGTIPQRYAAIIPFILIVAIPVKLLWHALFKLYKVTWRHVGLVEILHVGKASSGAALSLAGILFLLREVAQFGAFPRSVLILDYLLGTVLVAVFRLSRRLAEELSNPNRNGKKGIQVLLVGAGAAGERIARSMMNGSNGGRCPVGFIDDDTAKHGTYIHGLKVLGGKETIPVVAKRFGVEEVIITIPSAPAMVIREFVRQARQASVKRVKVLPSIGELLAGRVAIQDIRDVDLEDLLGRQSVRLDSGRVNSFLAGRTVLVTGAGGSIGGELSRQLCRMEIARLVILDNSESALFEMEHDLLQERAVPQVHTVIADVRDAEKIDRVFAAWKPDVVYHAAAYKHVPMMEAHADEAVRTNIFGTLSVAEAALRCGAHTFVLISSDKAVRPSSVMGATKRIAELVVSSLNGRGATRFMAVRFGNVIGSRGSVIPTMQEQIRRRGPVTVTHPEMTRYFMSAREAVALVLHASAETGSHDIYMLDMGEPVKILDLAEELIRLSGFEPDKDIPIVFSGMRPGERLHEMLETTEEPLSVTEVPKTYAVHCKTRVDEVTMRLALQELSRLSRAQDTAGVKSILKRLTTDGEWSVLQPASPRRSDAIPAS